MLYQSQPYCWVRSQSRKMARAKTFSQGKFKIPPSSGRNDPKTIRQKKGLRASAAEKAEEKRKMTKGFPPRRETTKNCNPFLKPERKTLSANRDLKEYQAQTRKS